MKFFNTAGPIVQEDHYCIDPLKRIDLNNVLSLIDEKKYFVLHAPRQTGKTSTLLALRDYLNEKGKFHAIYMNVEDAQTARNDVENGITTICQILQTRIRITRKSLLGLYSDILQKMSKIKGNHKFHSVLSSFCEYLDKPLVLLIDEIDSLVGDTLISVLRQLRSGYSDRPLNFPHSVILCGVRDVRDYRIHSKEHNEIITGGSAFNIKSESLRVGNFDFEEVKELLLKHKTETGQTFENDIFSYVWDLTEGQPWLVNALAYETCFKIQKDRSKPITKNLFEQAKESVILRRDTHIDVLIDKLSEERVRRVIEPILNSDSFPKNLDEKDIMYVRDMGLITKKGNWVISNLIYKEVIPRELVYATQTMIAEEVSWYEDNNKLNMVKLLKRFQEFFRDNSEMWLERFQYKEAGPHLLLMAFLQRIINGGGKIFREYGLGTRRIDLLIEYKGQRFAIETKVYRNDQTKSRGLEQLQMYMDKSGAFEGHLIIFNKKPDILWEDKLYHESHNDQIDIWGM